MKELIAEYGVSIAIMIIGLGLVAGMSYLLNYLSAIPL